MDRVPIGLQIFLCGIVAFSLAERMWPSLPVPNGQFRRQIRNTLLATLNLFVLGSMAWMLTEATVLKGGLLHLVLLPRVLEVALGVLFLDFGNYIIHRLQHEVPWLWRIHRLHHMDMHLDSTSAMRFHPIENVLRIIGFGLIIVSLGVPLDSVALYQALALSILLLSHANIAIPDRIETTIGAFVVSPTMHRIHHSPLRADHDSNYSIVFPWWDSLLRTRKKSRQSSTVSIGLSNRPETSLGKLILDPFV